MDHFTKQAVALLESQSGTRLDANETFFLERELTQLRAKVFDVQYAPILGLNFIPLATDIAADVETYTYKTLDVVGRARIGGPPDDAPPRVDVKGFETTGKVYPIEAAYGWDIMDMRRAIRLGASISDRKAMATKMVISTGIDDMLVNGKPQDDTSTNISTTGFANASGVTVHGTAFTDWVAGTDDDVIIDEVTAFINEQMVAAKQVGTLMGDTLALPYNRYLIAKNKRLGVDNDSTVLSFLQKNHPGIKFEGWHRLSAVTAAGKDRAVFYAKNPMVLEAVVPIMFEQLPPQPKNGEFSVYCFARCGGVKVYQPVGMRYRDWP